MNRKECTYFFDNKNEKNIKAGDLPKILEEY